MNTVFIIKKNLRAYWWLVTGGLAAIACLELLSLYGPQLIKQAVDLLASGRADRQKLLHLAGTLVVLAVGVALLRAVGRPLMLAFGRLVERDLRNQFFTHITELPRMFLDRRPAGDIMARATYDMDNIRLAAGYGCQAAFSSLLTLVLALAYMIWMSPLLTLLSAVPMTLIPWLTRRQSRRFHACHQNIQQSFGSLTESSRDSLSAIRLLKAYDLGDMTRRRFQAKAKAHLDRNMELARVSALYLPVMTTILHMSQTIVWGGGGAMAVLGGVTPGDIVAFSAYLAMMRSPLLYSGYLINLSQRARSSSLRVDEIFDQAIETGDRLPGVSMSREHRPDEVEDIVIDDLTFAYPGEPEPVLKNLSMQIPAIAASAITGPVGSGKSTLFQLLTRIYEPPERTIYIGGRDITRIPVAALRARIAMTVQEPFVFSGCVRENLMLAAPSATEEELWQVLSDVGLADEIAALPGRLDAELGERAHILSGGQKARLSVARTLLSRRPLFLMDDPLSSVDTRAEGAVLNNLARLQNDRTHVMISHRPLSLSFCSSIFVLDNGRITAKGSHGELMRKSSLYQKLALAQHLKLRVKGDVDAPY